MLDGSCVAVVVPAHDESRHIRATLRSIPAYVDVVVVVDDASRDTTLALAHAEAHRDRRVIVVAHAENRGVGAAIATGYETAFARGADVAAVMAGDAQMDPADLPALLAPVVAGEAEYAKGDRLSWPGARRLMPWTRFVGTHLFSILTRLATGLPVRDSQCGYTAISRHAAEAIDVSSIWPGYGYPNDVLARLARQGLAIRDVRVRPVYAGERSELGPRHVLVIIPGVLFRALRARISSALARALTRAPRASAPAAVLDQSRPT